MHSIDPRLIGEAASEMVQVVRLIARVVRCREWLCLETAPAEALELEGAAGRGVQLVSEKALYDALLSVVLGSDMALEALRNASLD